MIRRIAALATSFNRRELTVASLTSLFSQQAASSQEVTVFLVDDGSRDGTAKAVAEKFPQVRLLHGDGSLFWNGGMRMAFEAALEEDFDAYIWFNDDTRLYPNALCRVVGCAELAMAGHRVAIVAGSTRSPRTGKRSYGGWRKRVQGFALWLEPISPEPDRPVDCDTINGNFTLIPREVALRLGNLEPRFRHQYGDLDYGLRARQAGFHLLLAPGFVGECDNNPAEGTWKDRSLTFKQRWKQLMSPKGAPPVEWFLFTRRHYGWRWPLYAVSPYLKTLLRR